MKNTGVDIEKLLRENKAIQIRPQGYSMYPFLVPGRDEVVIESVDPHKVKRGDVILYRRTGSILVLHRVYRHDKTGIYMVGDNQTEIEGNMSQCQHPSTGLPAEYGLDFGFFARSLEKPYVNY